MALFTKDGVNSIAGTAAADLIIVADPEHALIGTIDGGAGFDELRFTSTIAEYLILGANVTNIEAVVIGTGTAAAAVTSGNSAEAVDASLVGNALSLTGNAGANEIIGTMFADTLIGGLGQDSLYGGEGNDLFIINSATEHGANEVIDGEDDFDTLVFASVTAGQTLVLSAGTDVERILIGTAAGVTTGMTLLNVDASANGSVTGVAITGNSGGNLITGSAYSDVLNGGAGADTVIGGEGNDRVLILALADYAAGESLNGGAGNDTVVFASTTAGQILTLNASTAGIEQVEIADAQGSAAGTTALGIDARNVANGLAILGNKGANVITGTVGVDTFYGQEGNDVFIILSGAHHAVGESIDGGGTGPNTGNDEIRFASTLAGDTLVLGESINQIERIVIGTGTGAAAVTTGTLQLNVDLSENTTFFGAVVGNAGGNVITGNDNANTLTGGAGNDTLDGGGFGDLYLYLTASDMGASEQINDSGFPDDGLGAADILRFAGSGTLKLSAAIQGIERIELTGTTPTTAVGLNAAALGEIPFALWILGNAGNNSIIGTAFPDVIVGGPGKDTLNGGGGIDNFHADNASDAVGDVFIGGAGDDLLSVAGGGMLVLTAATNSIEEIYLENAGINASVLAGGVRITGNVSAQTITGGSGNDTIDGTLGDDVLSGGGGNDTFIFGAAYSADISLNGGAGFDTVLVGVLEGITTYLPTLIAGIEAVMIGGTANAGFIGASATNGLFITGNAGDNSITGTQFADTISGGGGNDTINILGADTEVGAVADGGAGVDVLLYTPVEQRESLTFSGIGSVESIKIANLAGLLGPGQSWTNLNAAAATSGMSIEGNNFSNAINGGRFADSIVGSANTQQPLTEFVDNANDHDTLVGGAGNDTLIGGAGNNVISGGSGNDRFIGWVGNEILSGGSGDDSFTFVTFLGSIGAGDRVLGGSGTDRIQLTDANHNLDLEAIPDNALSSVEVFDITGSGNNSLNLTVADVLAMVGAGGTLTVDGNAGDELSSPEDWGAGVLAGGYYTYTLSGVSIQVDEDVLAFT